MSRSCQPATCRIAVFQQFPLSAAKVQVLSTLCQGTPSDHGIQSPWPHAVAARYADMAAATRARTEKPVPPCNVASWLRNRAGASGHASAFVVSAANQK
eukprot:4835673-Amphidinium_carterae.1